MTLTNPCVQDGDTPKSTTNVEMQYPGDAEDKAQSLMKELQQCCVKDGRKALKQLRVEQISQGVLGRLLKSLGRLTFEEVNQSTRMS